MRRDPRITMSILDPQNPYRFWEVRGRVVEITEQCADEHIDRLAKKYLGADKYPRRRQNFVPWGKAVWQIIWEERSNRYEKGSTGCARADRGNQPPGAESAVL